MRKKQETQPIVRYSPDKSTGLTQEQVNERILSKSINNTRIKSSRSYFSIFARNTFTFFNLIWLIIAIALCIVGSYTDLMFLFVIIANTTIAIIQEIKAKITVERLSLTTKPKVKVIRDGKEVEIDSENLVLDDIIILSNGNEIPADCIIIEGKVEVNESLLTGESTSIKKHKNDPLLSGSFIVSGKCYARIDRVGKDIYIQQIASRAKEFKAPSSNLFKDLKNLIRVIGILLVPLGILTIFKELSISGNDLTSSIKNTSGAITGMIPAGMFLLITIALSVGVVKLGRKKTLVKDIYSIEMLARTNVLCLDKTGTITDGSMNVVEMINLSKTTTPVIEEIISNILSAQNTNNSTFHALVEKYSTAQTLFPTQVVDFSSERKFSVTSFDNGKTYYLGAPSFTNVKMTEEQRQILKDKLAEGYRVVALVESSKPYDEKEGAKGERLLAFIVLEDHIRTDAIDTIKWFKENNVEIKIISGDDPLTVSKIAQRVGVDNYDKYVSLENMSLIEVEQLADKFTVFGRVSPEQKHTLIKSLKAKGNVVAMTGDGVNDTLALKEADCSIAMADGSEVARNISNLVLMDSKFSSLPSVVQEGRQVVNNVQNSSVLFLMKTLFTIILCIITLITATQYPFAPSHLFLTELFVIGLPSFLLTFEPNKKLIQGNFIPQVLKKAIPRSIIMLLAVVVAVGLGYEGDEYTTLVTLVLTTVSFANLCWLCLSQPSWIRILTLIASAGCICIAGALLPKIFGLVSFTNSVFIAWGIITAVSAVIMIISGIIVRYWRKYPDRKPKIKKKKERD